MSSFSYFKLKTVQKKNILLTFLLFFFQPTKDTAEAVSDDEEIDDMQSRLESLRSA